MLVAGDKPQEDLGQVVRARAMQGRVVRGRAVVSEARTQGLWEVCRL